VVPEVTTDNSTNVQPEAATLNGTIDDTGDGTVTRYFEYADTEDKLGTEDADIVNVGTGEAGSYSANISGLNVNTTYYFRAYATNEAGTDYGEIKTFETEIATPEVSTQDATLIDVYTARLHGTLDYKGGDPATTRHFEWADNASFEDSSTVDLGVGDLGTYNYDVSGLNYETDYWFRAYAVNDAGRTNGETETFRTLYPWISAPEVISPEPAERTEDRHPWFVFVLTENSDNPATKYHARVRISEYISMEEATVYESKENTGTWQYWDGGAWQTFPSEGVDPGTRVRMQNDRFAVGGWYWDCAAHDGDRYNLNIYPQLLRILAAIEGLYDLRIEGKSWDALSFRVVETSNGEIGEIIIDIDNSKQYFEDEESWGYLHPGQPYYYGDLYTANDLIEYGDVVELGVLDAQGNREDFTGRVRRKTPYGLVLTVKAILGDGVLSERIIYNDYPLAENATNITNAASHDGGDKTQITATSHGLSNGDRVEISGTDLYDGLWTISEVGEDDFVIDVEFDESVSEGTVNLLEDVGVTVKHIIDTYCQPITSNNINTNTGYIAPVRANEKTAVAVLEELRRSWGIYYYVDADWDMHFYLPSIISDYAMVIRRGDW